MTDPITPILIALAAGAAAGAQGIASEAVKDTYSGLKASILRRFLGKRSAESALAKYEQNPKQWEELLKAELVEVAAGQDKEIIEKSKKLIALINSQHNNGSIKQQIKNTGEIKQQINISKVDLLTISPPND